MTTEDRFGPAPGCADEGNAATECTECPAEGATEIQSVQRITEDYQDSVNSVNSVNSIRSVNSVHSVVRDTLPRNADGWRASLFKFTRALKFDCGMDGANMATIRPHVEEWHKEASAVMAVVPFSEVWGEVVTSWERAKHPAFYDPLSAALDTAREEGNTPPVPARVGYDEADVALAYRLLFWLTLDDHRFFVSCRALGQRLGIDHTKAWRILRMFEADGIIVCLKRGKRPKASRYRWNGTVMPPATV